MFVAFNTIYVFLGIMILLAFIILVFVNDSDKPQELSNNSIAEIRRQRTLIKN